MKKSLAIAILIISALHIIAQENSKKIKFYGIIRNDIYFNSRANEEAAEGLFQKYPKPQSLDPNGNDLNQVPTVQMVNIGTRFGIDIIGPELLKSKSTAKLEVDFTGFGTNNILLRFRHAYTQFKWDRSELLIGQTWHPLYGNLTPSVLNYNNGSPFQPFGRNPQLKFTSKLRTLDFNIAAIYQLQYMSDGPAGASNDYLSNAMLPELFIGLENKTSNWLIGVGASYKTIAPRVNAVSLIDAKAYKVNEKVSGYNAIAYAQYTKSLFTAKTKVTYGQNASNLSMIGGYGVSEIASDSIEQKYTAFNTGSAWLNFTYGKKYLVGLLAGYTKNLGCDAPLLLIDNNAQLYGNGLKLSNGINDIFRIGGVISYNLPEWKIGLEYDYTGVGYGDMNEKNGLVTTTQSVYNHRLLVQIAYLF